MECEICGRAATKKAVVEETLLNVCANCLKLGREFKEIEPKPAQPRVYPIEEFSINPSFATLIKAKREALGLSREQLAASVKEKLSVIERIEHGMCPTADVVRKLEKALKIKLLGYSVLENKFPKQTDAGVTLGDIAAVRLKKKK